MFDLKPLKTIDNRLILGIPWRIRYLFFGIALFLSLVMIINSLFTLVLGLQLLVSVLAGLYTEEWLFDAKQKRVVHTEGLLFLNRKTSLAMEDVVQVELRNSRPIEAIPTDEFGSEFPDNPPDPELEQANPNRIRGRGFSALFLILSDGREINIHTTSIKKAQTQFTLGRLISQTCQKPFSAGS